MLPKIIHMYVLQKEEYVSYVYKILPQMCQYLFRSIYVWIYIHFYMYNKNCNTLQVLLYIKTDDSLIQFRMHKCSRTSCVQYNLLIYLQLQQQKKNTGNKQIKFVLPQPFFCWFCMCFVGLKLLLQYLYKNK